MKFNYLITLMIFLHFSSKSQNIIYNNLSQVITNVNPSFAGSNGLIRYQSVVKMQQINNELNETTLFNGFDTYIKKIHGGVALSHSYSNISNNYILLNSFNLSYAQHISLFKGKLNIIPSLQATYFKDEQKNNYLGYGCRIAPNYYSNLKNTREDVKFSTGLVINYKHFYIGATAFNFSKYDEYSYYQNKKYSFVTPQLLSFHASYNVILPKLSLLFFGYANYSETFQLGVNSLLYRHFIVGASINLYGEPVYVIGYKHNYFNLTLSNNHHLKRNMTDYKSNNWEFGASFNLRNKENRKQITDFERW